MTATAQKINRKQMHFLKRPGDVAKAEQIKHSMAFIYLALMTTNNETKGHIDRPKREVCHAQGLRLQTLPNARRDSLTDHCTKVNPPAIL